MKDLRRRFERFCLKNRGKGIPNLMLVIAIGNLAVYALSYIDPSNIVYSYLCFSRSAILRGQVWRLFSYIFTYLNDVRGAGLLLAAVSLFCYYQFGKILESYWGTFRFNLYYLTGLVLTDLAAMLLGAGADASALNLSLFLAVATIAPEAKVLLFFFIPIKMKYMAWVYLGFTVLNVFSSLQLASFLSFYWLPARTPIGQAPTAPNPARSPTGINARSAAGRIRTIRTSNSATARSAMAITATASITSTIMSTSPRPRRARKRNKTEDCHE